MPLRNAAILSLMLVGACGPAGDDDAPSADTPLVELDHVYVIVSEPSAAVAALGEAGITVDSTSLTRHDGQGTASVAATFESAYLEILWADSTVALAEGAAEDIAHFPEASAWQAGGPSPFGIGLRRRTAGSGPLPYRGMEVEGEDWVEAGETFFAFETEGDEPRVFVVPDYMALTSWKEELRDMAPGMFVHAAGVVDLTSVRVVGVAEPASVAEAELAGVSFEEPGAAPLLELTFDEGAAGVTTDLRPELPILIRR